MRVHVAYVGGVAGTGGVAGYIPYYLKERFCPQPYHDDFAGWFEGSYESGLEPRWNVTAAVGDQVITMPLDDFVAMGFLRKD